jgi:hypothetical protein
MDRNYKALTSLFLMGAFVVLLFGAFAVYMVTGDGFSAAIPLSVFAALLNVGLDGLLNKKKH